MKITLDEFFENSFVMSIDDAKLNVMYRDFEEYFPGLPRPRRYPGFKHKGLTGVANSSFGHEGIVRTAKALGLPFVVIFEDDAHPCIDICDKLGKQLDSIPDDMPFLILGRSHVSGETSIVPGTRIRRLNKGVLWGAHTYIVFSSFFDEFLAAYDRYPGTPADWWRKLFGFAYYTEDNMFIQHNMYNTSNCGHALGYRFDNRDSLYPPPGFKPVGGVFYTRSGRDLEELKKVVSYTKMEDITMVEVGSYAGASASAFASMPQVGTLWCVDAWSPGYDSKEPLSDGERNDYSMVEQEFDVVKQAYPDKIKKFKGTLEEFLAANPGISPDIYYIDANHQYEYAKDDIARAKATNPRFIAGHDFRMSGVSRAIKEELGTVDCTFKDGGCSWIKRMEV